MEGDCAHPYSTLWISPSGCVMGVPLTADLNKDGRRRGAFPRSQGELRDLPIRHCVADRPGIHSWGNPNCSFIFLLLKPEGQADD